MVEVGVLSSLKLTTYKGCSFAYYLKYVVHEKVPSNVRLVFGKEIHYMLEQFYKKNFKSEETFVNFWKYRWFSSIAGNFLKGKEKKGLVVTEIPCSNDFILKIGDHINFGGCDALPLFFMYKNLGESILSKFYNRHKNQKKPIYTELSFGNKKLESISINGHKVRGVFDRIDEKNYEFYITDYKTDKSSPEKDSFALHRNSQFTLYSYVFRQLFGKTEKAILYYHLRSGDVFKTHRNDKDFDYLNTLLDEVSEGILKNNFVPFYGFHCNFCDLRVACEKYNINFHDGPRINLEGKIKSAEKFLEWEDQIPSWMNENDTEE
jgi:CRISPR/Cas system-associated exonuclease Cas4 (RecB family)